jgi:hypothetical protein
VPQWIRQEKRWAIYARDGFACCYCNRDITTLHFTGDTLTLDHRAPRHAHRGRDAVVAARLLRRRNAPTNLLTACFYCNNQRKLTPLDAWLQEIMPTGMIRAWHLRQHRRDRAFHDGLAQDLARQIVGARPRFYVEHASTTRRIFRASARSDDPRMDEPVPDAVLAEYRQIVAAWQLPREREDRQQWLPLRPAPRLPHATQTRMVGAW